MTPVQRKDHLDTLAITLLVACCAFWGFQQILIKFASREIPPLWQASVRMAGATALLWLWCQLRGVKLFQRDGSLKGGLLVGLLFAGEFCFIYLGLTHTSASRLTVFLYTSPFWVALLLPRFVQAEKLRRIQWIGLTLAFTAVAVAFSEAFLHASAPALSGPLAPPLRGSLPPGGASPAWGGPAPGQWIGDAMGLAAGMLWGLTTLAIRTTRVATVAAEKSLFYQLGVTAVVAPLLSLALGETWGFGYSAMAWGSVFLQTAVGAFASYLTWMWMLRHYPATQMSTFTFLTPVFALVFGVVLLGEPLTLQLVLALLGVAAGIVLVSRRG
ncbi:transporter [Hydrogenophaga taeniospiralis CCUG 15921]|uniref:Transporter n=1 Tax=Hydrogenophaga taeniospiralis CCUG 15921 TaxID=1281780 RepID=A0A9X4NQU2_9BURK|nr:DMT family transporter [Hydrogenophaga taeniospiralis]MDG5974211.1 transporter [Hydrogenophaga taeniospiralis CCUG 15921]